MKLPEIEYIPELAAEYIHRYMSDELQEKFAIEDILVILELESKYRDNAGLVSEEINSIIDSHNKINYDEKMCYFIIHQAVKKDIIMIKEEMKVILYLEICYMNEIGMIQPYLT